MPTVKLNKQIFEKLVGKVLPDDKLNNRISMMGTDLDSIEDNEINVEIFPNRPDLLSEQGFARAFSAFIGVKKGLREYKVKGGGGKVIIDDSLKNVRPYTACAVVKNLNFDDEKIREIIQIQEKLHTSYGRNRKRCAIGIYPLEKIRLPIKFEARTPEDIEFIPLESPMMMNANQIIEEHPTGKAYGHLLKDLEKYPIFVDANDEILSMPPIINSHNVGKVSEKTKEVFIECSGFDFEVLHICLNIIVTALADMGGEIYSMDLEYRDGNKTTPILEPSKIKLDKDYLNKILGLNLSEDELKDCLERMNYGFEEGYVLVPAYRSDIIHQIDFAEDIAIAYGYENFEPIIPTIATIGNEEPFEIFIRKIAYILTGLGLLECNTFHISGTQSQKDKMECDIKVIELANSLTEDYHALRAWIIPGLMEVFHNNRQYEYPQKIFDHGKVFLHDDESESKIKEVTRLGVALASDETNYTEILQIFESLIGMLGITYDTRKESRMQIKPVKHTSFIDGRTARISIDGKDVAYIGEVQPKVLENWDIKVPVTAFELNLSELFKLL